MSDTDTMLAIGIMEDIWHELGAEIVQWTIDNTDFWENDLIYPYMNEDEDPADINWDEIFYNFLNRFKTDAYADEEHIQIIRVVYGDVGFLLDTEHMGGHKYGVGSTGVSDTAITSWTYSNDPYMGEVVGTDHDIIIVDGQVALDDVDWATTIAMNISVHWDEKEIVIPDGTQLWDINVLRNGEPMTTMEEGFAAETSKSKVIKKCQRCGGKAKMTWVQAKCSDLYNQVNINTGKEYDGYVPDWIGTYGDYVIFTICRHCGQVQGEWPELDAKLNQFKSGKANTADYIFDAESGWGGMNLAGGVDEINRMLGKKIKYNKKMPVGRWAAEDSLDEMIEKVGILNEAWNKDVDPDKVKAAKKGAKSDYVGVWTNTPKLPKFPPAGQSWCALQPFYDTLVKQDQKRKGRFKRLGTALKPSQKLVVTDGAGIGNREFIVGPRGTDVAYKQYQRKCNKCSQAWVASQKDVDKGNKAKERCWKCGAVNNYTENKVSIAYREIKFPVTTPDCNDTLAYVSLTGDPAKKLESVLRPGSVIEVQGWIKPGKEWKYKNNKKFLVDALLITLGSTQHGGFVKLIKR